MKGLVNIDIDKGKHISCKCCSVQEHENERIYKVEFKFGNHTTLIRLCDKHLKQLHDEASLWME